MRCFGLTTIFFCAFSAVGMATDTAAYKDALMVRIDLLQLLPEGSLADKNILGDISSFSQHHLVADDHAELIEILVRGSAKDVSAFKAYATYSAVETRYLCILKEGVLALAQGKKQYISAQAPAAYEIYIALLKKIADLKKVAGPLL